MAYSSLSKPLLYDSQLKYRLGLIKQRMSSYPVDGMNFILMDLEHPQLRFRHAHQCTYDLTGRLLFFYAQADGVDGEHIEALPELYQRIMNNRHTSGTFGMYSEEEGKFTEEVPYIGTHMISGLVSYYTLTGDMRALNAAKEAVGFLERHGDAFYAKIGNPTGPNQLICWVTEGLADLYRETGEERYLNMVRRIARECLGQFRNAHSHGYLTTLRGLLKAGIYAQDEELLQLVKARRQEILDEGAPLPNGDISEGFPRSSRNEGCSIADWILLNLLYAYQFGDDAAYEMAEHSLWNALYFNQFITGGFGHRYFAKRGYRTYIEEAWWCCTPNAGMALCEVARHTVTLQQGKLKLNFLIPGQYTIPTQQGDITVTVTTQYPQKAATIVKVVGTKAELEVRIPDFIKGVSCRRVETPLGYTLCLEGRMGHYTEERGGGTIVKYGPLVIAPMRYFWNMRDEEEEAKTTIPTGYLHKGLYSTDFRLDLDEPDADGFYSFAHDPLPTWIIFEEGEMAGISGGEVASAHVPVVFFDGHRTELFFQPLCGATSNLTLMDVISDFDVAESNP